MSSPAQSSPAQSSPAQSSPAQSSPAQEIRAFYTLQSLGDSECANATSQDTCPICHSAQIVTTGVIVCCVCGSTLGPEIQNGSETQFAGHDDDSRCNNIHNPLLDESNYNTSIAGDSYMKRLNQWSHVPYVEKMLAHEFRTIDEVVRRAMIDHTVARTAQLLYKEAVVFQRSAESSDKKRKIGLLEACIYYACAQHGVTFTHRDIANFCGSTETRVTRGCKFYFQMMSKSTKSQTISGTDSVTVYGQRFCNNLGLTCAQTDLVIALINRVERLKFLNETPPSIAGACLDLASVIYNFRLSRATIATQSGISQVTLAKISKKLLKVLDKIVI